MGCCRKIDVVSHLSDRSPKPCGETENYTVTAMVEEAELRLVVSKHYSSHERTWSKSSHRSQAKSGMEYRSYRSEQSTRCPPDIYFRCG